MKTFLKLTVAFALTGFVATAAAGAETRIGSLGATLAVPVKSYVARKFESVVKQKYDFSCGSAALATLLSYHYDRPVGEEDVFDAMWAVGDQNNIRAKGFSLLDMKLYLQSIGLRSDGFQLPLETLRKIGVPSIALIMRKGYAHFVVLRGIAKDYVVIGDPARGAVTVPRAAFEASWNGIAFAIYNDAQIARAHFNLIRDLPISTRAELGGALNPQSLAGITVLLPGRSEF